MRFDTEEAFFKATFAASGTSPTYIAYASEQADSGKRDVTIRTEVVRILRGAFEVHQRADAQLGPGDSLLGYRLKQAESELPEGWRLVVMVERGTIRVDLYDPNDERCILPERRQDISGQATDAMQHAADATTKEAK